MTYEEILHKTNDLFSFLPLECQQEFIAKSTVKTYNKGEIVVREGQISQKAYLIIQGCSRAYYLKNGKDISDWFAFENDLMSPIISFFSNKPSPHYIEFVEDSVVIEFSKEITESLSEKYRNFERLINQVVTKTMLGLCERLYTIQFNKAEERYNHLLSIYPNITNRIPLTHIASYIGITLETLSRIRNHKNRI